MKKIKFFTFAILGLLLLSLVIWIILLIYPKLKAYNAEKADYSRVTTPLSYGVDRDLCVKMNIPTQDKRCVPGAIVYAPDFFGDLRKYFRNLPKEKSTKDEVDKILGPYLKGCEPLGEKYFICTYDLRGDGTFEIVVSFDKGGEIYLFAASTGSQ